jgi:D-3-phosphoglycerate dehydrogenase
MKVLVSDSLEQSLIDVLTHEGFEVDNKPGLPADELKKIIGLYHGLVVRSSTKVTAELISLANSMKVIGRAGTGVDNIDVGAATRRGILVMNTPGGNTISAAEHTVSMMLSLARNIPQAHMSLAKGEWQRKLFIGTEVFEKTLGVIGLGKIGREVAQRCQGFGMNTIGYDPLLSADVALKSNIELVTLDELYRRSDFITVHTPLTTETKGLLNDTTLAKCKPGVRVINCARGGIIDEQALLKALESGRVAGAALDVFEVEPPKGNPLLSHLRVIATPHLGASTEEAQEKVAVQIAHQMADALHGRGYSGLVNGAALQLSIKEEVKPYLSLAEKLGSLVAQLTSGNVKLLTVLAFGDIVVSSLDLMKAGILKGILSHVYHDPVNIVNAPMLANEVGLVLGEERASVGESYTNMLGLRYQSEQETKEVAGAVFGSSTIRLVKLDGFRFEVRPEGFLLIYNNIDRPGMLAKVGLVLSKHNVNIAGVSLGRSAAGANALTVMNIDSEIPTGALEELLTQEGISNLKLVRLG